nr:retrovirus-related Pol polyprotein from transposon TNT 1-94 [Tanacetum cinerariifolium]
MDSMISIGQKNTLVKYMILSGADNCPPMLDKGLKLISFVKVYHLISIHLLIIIELPRINKKEFNYKCKIDSGLAVPVFKQGDDPIDAINKLMSFLSTGNSLTNLGDIRIICYMYFGTRANISGTAKAVLMANLSSYGSDVLSEDTNSSTQQDTMILSVFEQLSTQVTNSNKVNKDNLVANESLSAELERYKERIRQILYDGSVIAKETNVISIADSEETLMLEEESRSKMIIKQSDPMVLKQKVNIKPINYVVLNRLSKDFGKHFVPQQDLSNEQALHPNIDEFASSLSKLRLLGNFLRPRQLLPHVTPKSIHYTMMPWKIPYELLHDRKPDLSYLYVFGALCCPNNDSENLVKLQAKVDIGVFIGYAPKKKAYGIYNRCTQKIIETIHLDFDELTAMASEQLDSGPEHQFMTFATSSSVLVPNLIPQQPFLVVDAPRAVDFADSPVSMSVDQDAQSTSFPSTQDQEHSLLISQGFEESQKTPHFHDDPLHESLHEDSTSQGSSYNVRQIHTFFKSLSR